jgi:hypothetical protein
MVSDGLFEVTDAQVVDGAVCSVIPGLDTLADFVINAEIEPTLDAAVNGLN